MAAFVYPAPGTTVYPPAAAAGGSGDLMADGSVPMDNATALSGRNFADSADIEMIQVNASDQIVVGDAADDSLVLGTNGFSLQAGASGASTGNIYARTASFGASEFVDLFGWATATVLRFYADNFTDYVGIKAPATADDTTYTLPLADGSSGEVLSTNGSGVLSWAPKTPTKQIFTSGTGATYTTPTGAKLLKVTVVGGGGGGGGAASNATANHASAGGGGSGGGTAIAWIANPAASYTYTVGTGGAGGAAGANNGADGVDSVFNTTIIGGKGIKGDGGATQTGAICAVAKAGGTSSGGDINVGGGTGGPGLAFASAAFTSAQGFSGCGGTSSLGGGGAAVYTAGDGGDGGLYGSGGGGGAAAGQYNANAYAGGDGAPGIIIVEEFY